MIDTTHALIRMKQQEEELHAKSKARTPIDVEELQRDLHSLTLAVIDLLEFAHGVQHPKRLPIIFPTE